MRTLLSFVHLPIFSKCRLSAKFQKKVYLQPPPMARTRLVGPGLPPRSLPLCWTCSCCCKCNERLCLLGNSSYSSTLPGLSCARHSRDHVPRRGLYYALWARRTGAGAGRVEAQQLSARFGGKESKQLKSITPASRAPARASLTLLSLRSTAFLGARVFRCLRSPRRSLYASARAQTVSGSAAPVRVQREGWSRWRVLPTCAASGG